MKAWTAIDYRDWTVVAFESQWRQKVEERIRRRQVEEHAVTRFGAGVRYTLQDPLVCALQNENTPHEASDLPRWLYYACITYPEVRGAAVKVVTRQHQGESVFVTAFPVPRVHEPAYWLETDVDRRPHGVEEPCRRRYGRQ